MKLNKYICDYTHRQIVAAGTTVLMNTLPEALYLITYIKTNIAYNYE